MKIRTHLLPPERHTFTDADIAVVADILRATSAMTQALNVGVSCIYPCLELSEAEQMAEELPNALLCGERQGLKPTGFELGNSPGDYTEARCQGRPMVMTTTNGTRALLATTLAGVIYTLSFSNFRTVFHAIIRQKKNVHLVGSGTDGYISWEDSLACGMMAALLVRAGFEIGDDSTRIVISLYENELGWLGPDMTGYQEKLVEILKKGRGGRRVCEIGLEKDLVEVARINEFDILSEVVKNPLRVIRSTIA